MLITTLLVNIGACTPSVRRTGFTSSGSATLLTDDDLRRYETRSLLDALQSLRPYWLAGRSSPPSLMVDGAVSGDLTMLGQIPVSTVREVRLVRRSGPGQTMSRLAPNGDVIVEDMIVVLTRTR